MAGDFIPDQCVQCGRHLAESPHGAEADETFREARQISIDQRRTFAAHFQKILHDDARGGSADPHHATIDLLEKAINSSPLLCSLCMSACLIHVAERTSEILEDCDKYRKALATVKTECPHVEKARPVKESEVAGEAVDVGSGGDQGERRLSDWVNEWKVMETRLAYSRREVERLGNDALARLRQESAQNEYVDTIETRLHRESRICAMLTQANSLNDAFNILADGPYGTINGLRLGKRANDSSVTWDELNAAWGQVGFLLDALIQLTLTVYNEQLALAKRAQRLLTRKSRRQGSSESHAIDFEAGQSGGSTSPIVGEKPNGESDGAIHRESQTPDSSRETVEGPSVAVVGKGCLVGEPHQSATDEAKPSKEQSRLLNLQQYRILPRGSHTIVVRRSDAATFELYGGPANLTRFFTTSRFDQAMITVLSLFMDLTHLAELIGAAVFQVPKWTLQMPYAILGETVEGLSIRLPSASGSDEWTRCLRYFLIDLRWISGIIDHLASAVAIASHGSATSKEISADESARL